MIQITPTLWLDERELQEEFIRAAGPGGQNVNKVETAVQLRFDVLHSPSLPEEVRQRLMRLAANRITAEGVLVVSARRFRTQVQNREDALDQLIELIRRATFKPKPHIATRPTLASKQRRLESKKRQGERKKSRRYVASRDE